MSKQTRPFDGGKNENTCHSICNGVCVRHVSTDYTCCGHCAGTIVCMRYVLGFALLAVALYVTGEFLSCYFMLTGSPDWCERLL